MPTEFECARRSRVPQAPADGKAVAGGCLGGARRRNICAPHPILDGRRLGNHPFYRCPLNDSTAHAAPECRAHPLPARLSPRRRFRQHPPAMLLPRPGGGSSGIPPESPQAARAGKAVAAARPGTAPESPHAVGPRLSPRRFRPGTAGTAALLSPHNDSCRRRHGSASWAGRAPLQSPTTAMPRASEEPARPA